MRSQVALLSILLLCGAAAYPVPVMSIDSTAYSTVIQAPGGIISHVFDVTNAGNQTLKITGVLTSCTCTTVTPQKAELAPGKSAGISVYVDTSGFAGRVERTVTLQSNDPANPEVMLFISVTVVAAAQAKVQSISVVDVQKRFSLLVDVRTPEEFPEDAAAGEYILQLPRSAFGPRFPERRA